MINFLWLKSYYTYYRDLLKTEHLKPPTGVRDFCSTNGGANKERCSAERERT